MNCLDYIYGAHKTEKKVVDGAQENATTIWDSTRIFRRVFKRPYFHTIFTYVMMRKHYTRGSFAYVRDCKQTTPKIFTSISLIVLILYFLSDLKKDPYMGSNMIFNLISLLVKPWIIDNIAYIWICHIYLDWISEPNHPSIGFNHAFHSKLFIVEFVSDLIICIGIRSNIWPSVFYKISESDHLPVQ